MLALLHALLQFPLVVWFGKETMIIVCHFVLEQNGEKVINLRGYFMGTSWISEAMSNVCLLKTKEIIV